MTKLSFLAALLGSFLFACAAVPADADDVQGETTSAQRSAPIGVGSKYVMVQNAGAHTTTSFEVTSIEDESLDLTVTTVSDGIRDVQKFSAYGAHGTWEYDDGSTCHVRLDFSSNWSSASSSEAGSFDCDYVDHIKMNGRFVRAAK